MNIWTMVNAPDSLSPQGWLASLWQTVRRGWQGLGLLTQFMILLTVTMLFISAVSNKAIKQIAASSLVESSLEVEQAMARSVVLPVLGQEPIADSLDPEIGDLLRDVVSKHLNPRYINKIKLWGVNGRLLFDSHMANVPDSVLDPAVARVLAGETVVTVSDTGLRSRNHESVIGDLVYEVYMPLYGLNGQLIAVLEAYCSSDLLASRIRTTLQKIDQIRLSVLLLGMLMLSALVFYAQRRIQSQERQLIDSIRATESLAQRNSELLQQSEDIRRRSAEANEQLLNHIGAELHDGPIQLLSIAALYRGQADVEQVDNPFHEKSQQLFQKAMQELRNISVGLILPELEGASLCEAVSKAVEAVQRDWDMDIKLDLPQTDCHVPLQHLVVAYRVVYESLNNAWKHGASGECSVTLAITDRQFDIRIFNPTPVPEIGVAQEQPGTAVQDNGSNNGVGMIGMQKRVHGIGGTLRIEQVDGGMMVRVIAPMIEALG